MAALLSALAGGANAQGFVEKVIAHVPTSVNSLAVNDNGWVSWTTGRASGSQVYVWNRVSVLTLGAANDNDRDTQINNSGWVVWDGNRISNTATSDVYLWKSGGAVGVLSGAYPSAQNAVLDNLNDVAWWGGGVGSNAGIYDVYYISHTGTQITNLTQFDADGGAASPMLNDTGGLTWIRSTGVDASGASNLVAATVTAPASYFQVTGSSDLNVYQGLHGISNNGTLVWRQYNDAKLKWDVWKYVPGSPSGTIKNLSLNSTGSSYDPYILNNGTVAWHTDTATGAKIYWDKNDGAGAQLIPLAQAHAFNRPAALNNAGSVAYVSGDGSGTGFDIILAEAPAYTVSGTVTLTGATNAQQPITFTFRPIGGAEFTKTATLDSSGGFSLSGIPAQSYTLHIKSALWLARNVAIDAANGNVSGVAVSLESGDSNNDNACDVLDFGNLVNFYGSDSSVAGSGYDATADFNTDGKVDVLDFGLLVNSYGLMGDK